MKYILETERLLLREMDINDITELSKILCDPEAMKYYPQAFSMIQVRQWIEWNIENYKKYGHGLWALILKADNAFIGDCGITMQDIEGEKLPELGYHVKKEYWNKGYAAEACKACIDYSFDIFKFEKIFSYTKTDNLPSIRVAEKNGMRFVKE